MRSAVAVVTGASRGLGRSIAKSLAKRGVGVVGTFRSGSAQAVAAASEIAAAGGMAAMLPLDLGDMRSVTSFAGELAGTLRERFGRADFDHLVNNAGVGPSTAFVDTGEALFDEIVGINLKAPYFLTQALLPMIADGGNIVMVSSAITRFSLPNSTAYAASKAGIEALARCLAVELGPRRIRVNSVAPGAVETDIGGGVLRDDPALLKAIGETVALGRIGQPDDIGRAVAALLSDDFGWANGTRIELSGGQNL